MLLVTKFQGISAALRRAIASEVVGYMHFVLLAVVLLVVIWSVTAHLISVEESAAEGAASLSTREMMETYEAQMVRNLGAIDQTLRTIKYAYETQRGGQGKVFSLLELRQKGLLPPSLVFDIRLADRQGDMAIGWAGGGSLPLINVADQAYFLHHQQNDTGAAFVGKATRNPSNGEWALQFSRRLNRADGSFDGTAILAVDPGYFTSGYEVSRLHAQGVIALLGSDGEFRVKRSGDDVSSGQAVDYAAATHGALKEGGNAALLVSPWDGLERYTVARTLRGFPLTALVGLSRHEQLAPFYQHRRTYLVEATVASVLLIAIIAAVSRLNWQLTSSRRRMRRIQETYYSASEASLDAFFVLRSVPDGYGLITDFVFSDSNARGEALTRITKGALLGMSLRVVFPRSLNNGLLDDLIAVAETGNSRETEWNDADPSLPAEWLYRQVVQVEDGAVVIVRDISERKRLETKIHFQATHDTLTSLPNRHLLHERLQNAIANALRFEHSVWVMFIDLDRFKSINDILGHKAGDIFLQSVAARLQTQARVVDTVARLGGDEFVLVLPCTFEGGISSATAKRFMEIVSEPILIEEREFKLSCSVGVAIFPDDGATPELLIERADIAMYRAKESGRNTFQFFTAAMNERLVERLRLEADLRKAIVRNELILHYQPQVDLATDQIVGVEALIRWQHPQLGMVSPVRFIPLAEETGLIGPIGDWVIRTAVAQNVAWQCAGYGQLRLSVNLSAYQFGQPELVESIAAVLQEHAMESHQLEIELTESMVMKDVDRAISVLRNLKALGVKLSIDDFGTGYSSLSYLKRFPIDELKIDQSFVQDIATNTDDAAIVLAIISLAHSLRLRVIAEGVETASQLDFLRQHGCDEMQGYHFSRPLPAAELGKLLQQRKCLATAR